MPKKEQKLLGFHGGINDHSDPKDIQDIELVEATGVDVSKVGRIVGLGDTSGSAIVAQKDYDLQKGYGLFYYSSDHDSDGNLGTEDWLTYYHVDDNKIYLVTRDNGATDSFTLGSGAKPNYLVANGALRVSDSTFTNDTMWRAFVDSKLFQYNANKADYLTINEWVDTKQQLKSFDDLSVTLTTFDAGSANPADSQLTNVILGSAGHICLAYWKNDDGDWNGNYQFAATPMFKGNQEGPISVMQQGINFYDNQVSFQVYVSLGTQSWTGTGVNAEFSQLSDNSAHPLMDDRIIGINWYFRRDANDDWVLLQYTDLLEGDKYYWGEYNTTDHPTYGIFSGTLNIKSGNDLNLHKADDSGTLVGLDVDGITVSSGEVASYQNALLKATVTNNANGFTGRIGFLRAWGGFISPVYLNAVGNNEGIPLDSNATYNIPINTGGAGTREFMVELLDENLSVIAASDKVTITVTDVGTEPPPTYEDSNSS